MNGTWDHEKFHHRTYILPRTCNSMTWPNEGEEIRGLEGEGVRNSWILKRGASPYPSGGWTFCEGSSHQISRVWMSSCCLISLPVCLWLISAHFTHQICFDYLRLWRASTSLQAWAGSASASHSPDRAVKLHFHHEISVARQGVRTPCFPSQVELAQLGRRGIFFQLVNWATLD